MLQKDASYLFCDFSFSWQTRGCLQGYTCSMLNGKLEEPGKLPGRSELWTRIWLAEENLVPGFYSSSSICPPPPTPKSFFTLSPDRAEWRPNAELRIHSRSKVANEWMNDWADGWGLVSDEQHRPLGKASGLREFKGGFHTIKGLPGEGGYSHERHHSLITFMSPS